MPLPSYIELVPEKDDEEVLERMKASKSGKGLLGQMVKDARDHNWGLYRCDRLELAMLHKQKKEYFEALLVFLEVFYLDINGPQNVSHMFDPELDKGKKPKEWNPKRRFIAPAVIYYCQLMIKRTKTPFERVKSIFLNIMLAHFENLSLPISPEQAWVEIENLLLNWKRADAVK